MIPWKLPRRRLKNQEKVALTALYTSVDAIFSPVSFSLFLTSFREKSNNVDVNKSQDKIFISEQPYIVVWRHLNNLRPVF